MVQPWDYFHTPDTGHPGNLLTVENYLYRTQNGGGNPSNGPNVMYAQPWFTGDEALNVASFGLRVFVTGTAKVDLAVYEAKGERDIYPGNLIWQSSSAPEILPDNEVLYDSLGPVLKAVAQSFAAGKLYWFVTNTDGGTGQHICAYAGQVLNYPAGVLGRAAGGSGAIMLSVARTYTLGMPVTFPAGAELRAGSGFLNAVAPAIIVVPEPIMVITGEFERTRPMPAVIHDINTNADTFLAREVSLNSGPTTTGDFLRSFLRSQMGVSQTGLQRSIVGSPVSQAFGTPDGIQSMTRWSASVGVPTLMNGVDLSTDPTWVGHVHNTTSGASAGGTTQSPGTGFDGLSIITDGWTSSYTRLGEEFGIFSYYNIIADTSQLRVGNLTAQKNKQTLILGGGSFAKCVHGERPFSLLNTTEGPIFVAGGSDSGQASVWYFIGNVGGYSQHIVAGTDINKILVVLDTLHAGKLYLSQPDGLRVYGFDNIAGPLTLLYHIPAGFGFGLCELPDGRILWARDNTLNVVNPITGDLEASAQLADATWQAAGVAYAPSHIRAAVALISDIGQGTNTKLVYVDVKSQPTAYLPQQCSLYVPLSGAAAYSIDNTKARTKYSPDFYDGLFGLELEPDGLPGVRLLTGTSRMLHNGSPVQNPWLAAQVQTAFTIAFSFTPEYSSSIAAAANLPRTYYMGSGLAVTYGPTPSDSEQSLRVTASGSSGVVNGEGDWAIPTAIGERKFITLVYTNTDGGLPDPDINGPSTMRLYVNGELQAAYDARFTLNANAQARFGDNFGGTARGIVHGPIVGYPRRLSHVEIKALYNYMSALP